MKIDKFIFLDIDGPINTFQNIWNQKINGNPTISHEIHLPSHTLLELRRVVYYTNASIIISSSWRKDKDAMKNIERHFRNFGLRYDDTTPVFNYNHSRGDEIQKWISNYKKRYHRSHKIKYVIFDDKINDLINLHKGHIININPQLGITEELGNIAINILNTIP